jgi:hypothetical protein
MWNHEGQQNQMNGQQQLPQISMQMPGMHMGEQMPQPNFGSNEENKADLKPIVLSRNIFAQVETQNKVETLMHYLQTKQAHIN